MTPLAPPCSSAPRGRGSVSVRERLRPRRPRHDRAIAPVARIPALVTIALCLGSSVCLGSSGDGAASRVEEIALFRGDLVAAPTSIAAAPDRALWFTNERTGQVGRVTARGSPRRSRPRRQVPQGLSQ
jgi:streptogramin lyase